MGHSRSLFSSFQFTVDSKQMFDINKFLLVTGFEPRTSGKRSDRSTNWATTTSQGRLFAQGIPAIKDVPPTVTFMAQAQATFLCTWTPNIRVVQNSAITRCALVQINKYETIRLWFHFITYTHSCSGKSEIHTTLDITGMPPSWSLRLHGISCIRLALWLAATIASHHYG